MKWVLLLLLKFHLCFSLSPEVQLKFGKVRGSVEEVNGVKVNRFLGIPYAEPPVGALRFQKTVPYNDKWETSLDATKWTHICPQPLVKFMPPGMQDSQNEDCLHLNIWVPSAELHSENELKPVLIFIHGGAFSIGTATRQLLDATKLSAIGGVVVVTLNYRLGPLGFLYGGDESTPGNAGLWDQQLALEWVQDNIRYFGGDPDQVTISGESAGAMSVSSHLLSPDSDNFFNKAIVMSGAVVNDLPITSKSYALEKATQLATEVGCRTRESRKPLSRDEIDCMRGVTADLLVNAQFKRSVAGKSDNLDFWPFRPIYGDEFNPTAPIQAILSKKFKRNSTVLLGTTANEGITYDVLLNFVESKDLPTDKAGWLSRSKESFRRKNLGVIGFTDHVLESIFYDQVKPQDSQQAKNAYHAAGGSLTFDCPTNFFAKHLATENNVYQYLFDVPAESSGVGCKDGDIQPCHGDDMFFVFGVGLSNPVNIEASKNWIKFLTDFVKGKDLPVSKYVVEGNQVLAPYYTFRAEGKSQVRYGYKYYICSFWEDALHMQVKSRTQL